jgi:ElaB/YqjD/DUF883 family membrane-anchored ribosome-binding protein
LLKLGLAQKSDSNQIKEKSDMENRTSNERTAGTTGTTGATGSTGMTGPTGTSGTGTGTGTASALSQTAQDYGQKISEAATHAKEYVSDKVSVVSDKIKDLQNADLGELAENAKSYARQKPGQALLISAGVGLLLGLIIRGRR